MEEYNLVDLTSEQVISAIWEKGQKVEGFDPDLYRKDCCDAWMVRTKYGDITNPYGWEIDHIYPQALGGENHFCNLRPMNWKNNRSKGDDYPSYERKVTSDGVNNIVTEDVFTVGILLQKQLMKLYNIG